MLAKTTSIAMIPSFVALVIVSFFKGEIITMIYGPSFIKSVPTFTIHFLGAASGSILFWSTPLMQSLNLTNKRIKIYLIAILFNFIVAYLLTPYYGAIGIAIGLLTANLFINFSFAFYCLKK